jgi:aminoglycoside phosphotransferase (APT) family kinase protein
VWQAFIAARFCAQSDLAVNWPPGGFEDEMLVAPEQMVSRLEAFIAEQGRYATVKVENLTRVSGGVSHEIWAFEATLDSAEAKPVGKKLVLRLDPAGGNRLTSRRVEFLVMRAAYADGIPVARPLWLAEDPTVLGAQFFIMEHVAGDTIARRLLRDVGYARARQLMVGQMAEILARIHRIDVARHGLEFLPAPAAGDSAARTELSRFEQIYREFSADDPHPAFELAIRWLLANIPAHETRGLIHGDYRVGNVVFGPEGARAILDFELAHLGDPMEDVGWFLMRPWRYGEDDKPAGGLASREAFLEAYERAAGIPVDPKIVHFWEVLGNFRWGVITMHDARVYRDWRVPNIELASIGRRTAETELELLNLIE